MYGKTMYFEGPYQTTLFIPSALIFCSWLHSDGSFDQQSVWMIRYLFLLLKKLAFMCAFPPYVSQMYHVNLSCSALPARSQTGEFIPHQWLAPRLICSRGKINVCDACVCMRERVCVCFACVKRSLIDTHVLCIFYVAEGVQTAFCLCVCVRLLSRWYK